jgi:hypothetical protein
MLSAQLKQRLDVKDSLQMPTSKVPKTAIVPNIKAGVPVEFYLSRELPNHNLGFWLIRLQVGLNSKGGSLEQGRSR